MQLFLVIGNLRGLELVIVSILPIHLWSNIGLAKGVISKFLGWYRLLVLTACFILFSEVLLFCILNSYIVFK